MKTVPAVTWHSILQEKCCKQEYIKINSVGQKIHTPAALHLPVTQQFFIIVMSFYMTVIIWRLHQHYDKHKCVLPRLYNSSITSQQDWFQLRNWRPVIVTSHCSVSIFSALHQCMWKVSGLVTFCCQYKKASQTCFRTEKCYLGGLTLCFQDMVTHI